ncbi:MAG TPA: tetratricopeptide repeat protein [Candidatus Eremiobacteraceae bacterium]|nr:tetratricopeptide repeat protein [Candidatus Eremiobacteraceae bacterium]
MGSIPASAGGESHGRADALIAAARASAQSGDLETASASARRAAALPDCSAEDRVEAAGIIATAGDKPKAVELLLDAGSRFLYDSGDMPKARAAFAQAHALDPANLDVIFQMGQADVVEGRTQDALAKFIDVLRKSNLKHIPALFEAGCIYQANGQYDQAILAFKKVLDREKTHVQAVVHMGQLHQTKGMVPEALGYYLQAAEMARDVEQLGTAQQLCHMVLALDGANQKARFMLDDINDRAADALAAAEEAAALDGSAEAAAVETAPSTVVAQPAHSAAADAPRSAPAAPVVDTAAVAALDEKRLKLQKEIEELSGARLELEAGLARAKDEAEAAVSARAGTLTAKAQAEAELATLNEAIGRSRAQADELSRRKRDIENETQTAATALHEARQSESAVAASAEKRRAEIEAELAEIASRRAQEEASLADVTRAAEERKKELAALEAATKKLKDDHNAASAAAAEAAAAEAKLKGLHSRASADAEAATQRVADTKREAAEAEARREAAATAAAQNEAKLKTLESQAAESDAKLKAIQAQAAESDAKLKAIQAQAAAENDAIAKRLAAASKDAADAEARRENASALAAAAEAKLEALREQVKTATAGAADAGKLKQASAKLKEIETATAAAAATLAQSTSALEATEARKREADEAYARSKSLAAAAEEKRQAAALAADQAEALRAKREADAEALSSRLAAIEDARKDADAQVKLLATENAALSEVTAKVAAQRSALEAAQAAWREAEHGRTEASVEAERMRADCARLKDEAAKAREEAAAAHAQVAAASAAAASAPAPEQRRRATDESYAEAVVAVVPAEACADSLRTIETLAADGEMPFEVAAELAGLIHEGRSVEALRVARARANLEAKPAPYLLAVADLSRDLGDASGARETYRTLAAADPSKTGLVHQRLGQLFLTFADKGTAAALARDDAHYAFAQEPAKALEAYADLVARFPGDPSFRQELGEVHEKLGNIEAAGLAFSQAIAQYLVGDDANKAVELAPRLLAARPGDGQSLELVARAYERAGKTDDARKSLDEALGAYRAAGSAADLERVCRKLAEIADNPVPYRRELASLLKDVGDIGGAAEQLLEAAEKLLTWSNAADALALLREAAVLAAEVEPLRDRIAAAKERAVEAQGSVDAASRGSVFLARHQYEKAADAYRAAVEKNAYNADACYQLACLLTDQFPDLATAEQLLDNAAELRPGHTATRYRLCLVKAARGDVEQAVELLIALARFDENNGDFIDQFVERLEKDADTGSVAAKYRLGIAYRELGRVEEALVILQSIQRETEFIVLCLNAIGLCLRRQGLDTAAAKRFQKAIETPGYPEHQYNDALYNLGDLYEGKKDPESLALSLSSYEELYARDCTFRDIADRIKSVKSKLGATEGPKVKRLPNRSEASNDR